jgi:uroporphyrin-III C-methyltransferase/precorrin-2 dehydrogenase/sirohydrochlorin ferrochelatase
VTAALFPLFADLRDRSVLVVGGGMVAERKTEALLRAGARPLIGAPTLTPALQRWAEAGRLRWLVGEFDAAWLDEPVWLVIAATDDGRVNRAVAAGAEARRMLANVVDDAELSSFQVPAVVERGPLQIAISSGGGAPMVARHIRRQLETLLDDSWGALAELFTRQRARIRAAFPDTGTRRRFFERQLAGPLPRLLRQQRQREAEAQLLAALERPEAAGATGSVTLVGAGPGDPGLLTLNALRALNEADVILHDRLVSDAVLNLARRDAERIEVGKSAQGHSTRQEHIHALMLEHARRGHRVVRLKGGDPFVFGRGGEEMQHLRAQGIEVSVVNGITSGLAAATSLDVPLTHRDHAHGVILVTGHAKESGASPDWPTLAAAAAQGLTLVIYMGVAQAATLQSGLLQALPAHTPVAVVQHASQPQQRHALGTLGDLCGLIEREQLGSPAIILVGEVLRGLQARDDLPGSVRESLQMGVARVA